jgi:hypothetical protein
LLLAGGSLGLGQARDLLVELVDLALDVGDVIAPRYGFAV